MLNTRDLKKILSYNPTTGVFTWKIRISRRSLIGSPAGSLVVRQAKGLRYSQIKIHGKVYLTSRLAWLYMTGNWPKLYIDHIDKDPTNNRFSNLREVTSSQNNQNRTITKGTKSGVIGIHPVNSKWRAVICINYKVIHLGTFDTREEAITARNAGKKKYHTVG